MRYDFIGAHTLFLLNSVKISNRVEGKFFSPQHNNKESLTTDRFEPLNLEQLLHNSVFKKLLLARLHKKITHAKFRD